MPAPLISVIITPWNSGAYLPRCLDHLAAQSMQDFEIILVDNGSTDGSLQALEQRWPGLNFRIQSLERNMGYTLANNIGARLAGGTWLALLNSDAFPEVDWLKNLLLAAESHSEFTFFASRLIQANAPHLLDDCGNAYHVSGLAWKIFNNYPAKNFGQESVEVFSACGAAAFYDRQAFLQVSGFDEDFFSYLEDIDIGFRLRLMGHRCLYVPEAVVEHIGSASLGPRSDFAYYHSHRNMIWCFVQNMPDRLLWRFLPDHILVNLVYLANYSRLGKGKVLFQAKIDALRELRRALEKRKAIQNQRIVSDQDLLKTMDRNLFEPYLIGYHYRKVMSNNRMDGH